MKLLKSSKLNKKAPRGCFPEDVAEIAPNPALPDPFEFFDPDMGTGGRVVSKADWEKRRREIADLAQYYYFGYKQPTPQEASKLECRDVQVPETVIIDRQKVTEPGSFAVSLPGALSAGSFPTSRCAPYWNTGMKSGEAGATTGAACHHSGSRPQGQVCKNCAGRQKRRDKAGRGGGAGKRAGIRSWTGLIRGHSDRQTS